jgi:60 kDa SS-A/Ro ribonucleoprotein
MARTNKLVKTPQPKTHGGGTASKITPLQELQRSVLACLLWENTFYEEGVTVAERIVKLVHKCTPLQVADLAIEARHNMHLRHVPLLLVRELARHPKIKDYPGLVSTAVTAVIERADEIAELVSLYWKDKPGAPLSKQIKKGLAAAFAKFDEYQLAKYNRAYAVKLVDVLRLVRPKPVTDEQAALWGRLRDNTLATPDTWETSLSAGKNKKETFTRLLENGKLGYMALLRNLRGMEDAGVSSKLIKEAILERKGAHQVFPYRFLAAALHAPKFESELDQAMLAEVVTRPKLKGKTIIVVDISGSMGGMLSAKSTMSRISAACALAAVAREMCEEAVVYATAGNDSFRKHATDIVVARHGMALIDAIRAKNAKLGGGGIFLKQVSDYIAKKEGTADRVLVITDEQDCGSGHADHPDNSTLIAPRNYILNVGTDKCGIAYGKFTKISGFSEAVVTYIQAIEQSEDAAQQAG